MPADVCGVSIRAINLTIFLSQWLWDLTAGQATTAQIEIYAGQPTWAYLAALNQTTVKY
jgi:hypothetical protein